jgi:putative tryptophan/tyrosine transport system substrate-binding protein
VRRREVIAGLSATAAWPRAAGAQQKTSPLVGILRMPPAALDLFIRPFRAFMTGLGWEEGRTVAYRISYADGDAARMPELAKALATSGADVLVAAGTSSIRVLQNATATIPIVGLGEDFVGAGFAKSMARPGGNVTGVSILATELDAKRLEVLRAALPTARQIGLISDPGNPISAERWHLIEKAAQALGVRLAVFEARSEEELHRTLHLLKGAGLDAVNVLSSPFLNSVRDQIVAALTQARLPAIYQWTETARQGGLLAYGPSLSEAYRHVAELVDRVLKGAKPAELPIEQPTRIALIVNLKTARELGITIPPSLLIRADEVIE